jgi:hypothetical protein
MDSHASVIPGVFNPEEPGVSGLFLNSEGGDRYGNVR